MDQSTMETIQQVMPAVLFGILGVFLLFGLLFGLGRGFKRSLIRLLTVTLSLLLAFFLTPLIGSVLYNSGINIAGKTPAGWVDEMIKGVQESDTVDYLQPFLPYIKEYAVSLVFALINVVLFLVLYLIVKPISWIIYCIIAHHAAPKKDADGNKLPRHRLAGMGIGLVQGLVLFFFFMLPINGAVNIIGEVAAYETFNEQVTAQSVMVSSVEEDDEFDLMETLRGIDKGATAYHGVMRCTGMEFLTDRAFEFQTSMKIGNTRVNLRKDLVSGLKLASDLKAYQKIIDKVNDATDLNDGNMVRGLAVLNHNDYEILRTTAGRVLNMELLKLGDHVVGDLDQIMSDAYGDDKTKLAGTDLYKESIYGNLVQNCAREDKRAEFTVGLKAMVNYLTREKLNIVRDDVIHMIDFMEDMYTVKANYPDAAHAQPIILALTGDNSVIDYMNILVAEVGNNNRGYARNALVIDVLFDNITEMSFFKMITQDKADNFLRYSNFFDDIDDNEVAGLQTFLRDFTSQFMGKKAAGNNGNWAKLKNRLVDTMDLIIEYQDIGDEIEAITADLKDTGKYPENAGKDESELQTQAVIKYLSGLLDTTKNKQTEENLYYKKVDDLAKGLNKMVFTFDPVVPDFLKLQLGQLGLGDFNDVLMGLMDERDSTVWCKTFRNVINMTKLLDSDVLQSITQIDFSNPETAGKELLETLNELDQDEVADIAVELLKLNTVGEKLEEVLGDFEFNFDNTPAGQNVENKATALQNYLKNDWNNPANEATREDDLKALIGDLWTAVEQYMGA